MKNCFKKISACLISVVLMLSLFAPVYAAPAQQAPCANAQSQRAEDAKFALAEKIADTANIQIEAIVAFAQATPWDDAQLAVVTTNKIAKVAMISIEALGFNAVCEYTEYVIDGHTVLIDPIKAIRW